MRNQYYKDFGNTRKWYEGVIRTQDKQIFTWDEELILADGWVKYTPPVEEYIPMPQLEPSLEEKLNALLSLDSIGQEVVALDDPSALALKALFPPLIAMYGKEVHVGERYFWDNRLWKIIQNHFPQEDWKPDESPALYTEVQVVEWPEWVQPLGAETAYKEGDKVTFEGEHYISTVDGNVWNPAAYPAGWAKQ